MLRKSLRHATSGVCACVLLALALLSSANARAQTPQKSDEQSMASFIDSVARQVYALAWPTATYRSVALNGIDPVPGGFNVTVRLSGLSAFDGGDLWVRLVFLFRGGTLADIQVRDHNAILAAPFSTMKAVGTLAGQFAKQYAAQQSVPDTPPRSASNPPGAVPSTTTPPSTPLPAPVAAACITNTTDYEISFQFGSGDNTAWKHWTVPAHDQVSLWTPSTDSADAMPSLTIEYDDDYAPGYTPRRYVLGRTRATTPVSCANVAQYTFVAEGTKILVYAVHAPQ